MGILFDGSIYEFMEYNSGIVVSFELKFENDSNFVCFGVESVDVDNVFGR